MKKSKIDQIKESFSISQAIELLGLEVRQKEGTQAIHCVAHEDRNPSLVIMPDVNRVKCMSCGWSGDVIDLVQKVKNFSTSEAIDFFYPRQIEYNTQDPYTYLQDRGISKETADHFGLELRKHVDKKDHTCKDCNRPGIPTAVAIPIVKSKSGNKYKYRAINPQSKDKRYWGDAGYGGRLFKTCDPTKKAIILTEGEFDAMVIWQHTGYAAWTVVTGKATDLVKFADDFEKFTSIYIAYDNDTAGEEGAIKAAESLGFDRCYRLSVPKELGKDWTDFFLSGGTKKQLDKLIKEAKSYAQDSLLEEWEKQQEEDTFVVKTGVPYIDDVIGGFRSANTYVLGGLEKSGKSSLLLNFLDSMLKNTTYKVGYINTEFTLSDFVIRMAAIHNNLPKITVEQDKALARSWVKQFHSKILYAGIEGDGIKENNSLSFSKTMLKLQEFVRQGMQILFFDNATSFTTTGSDNKSNWETLSKCISHLITFSKEKNIVVIMVLHQKSNTIVVESAVRIKKMMDEGIPEAVFDNDLVLIRKPTLSDLFGGGTALSQISGAIFVWRPYQKFHDGKYSKYAKIIMESFRHSEGGGSRVIFDGAIGSFKKDEPPVQDPHPPEADPWYNILIDKEETY